MTSIASYAPDEQAIIREGYTACSDGLPIQSNPYTRGQGDWMLWIEGWIMRNNTSLIQAHPGR